MFPSTTQLKEYRRRLGDLLLENRLVTIAQLREALEAQQKHGKKLGQALMELGYLSEEDLLRVLGRQLNVAFGRIDYRLIEPLWLEKVPRETAEKLGVLPLQTVQGAVLVACIDPSQPEIKPAMEKLLGRSVELQLAPETDLRFAICQAYLSKENGASPMLGQILVRAGALSPADLDRALQLQRKQKRKLGEILQDLGLISFKQLSAALSVQSMEIKDQEVSR